MLLAVAEHRNIQSEFIPRIASGLCGGLAHTGGICGAVYGSILAINISLGRDIPDESNEHCYEVIREFMSRFTDRFGDVSCQKLTGLLVGTPEGKAAYFEKGLLKQCVEYVGGATRLVLELT